MTGLLESFFDTSVEAFTYDAMKEMVLAPSHLISLQISRTTSADQADL